METHKSFLLSMEAGCNIFIYQYTRTLGALIIKHTFVIKTLWKVIQTVSLNKIETCNECRFAPSCVKFCIYMCVLV